MDRKVRVGVIGAGSWAVSSHIPNFASRDDVELVVVNRLDQAVASMIKDKFNFS